MFGFAALADLKGDAFEGLLQKGAEDTKSGAGQYFTPRALTRAMIGCLQPKPGETIADPACGTGGFLLAAHEWIVDRHIAEMDADDKGSCATKRCMGGRSWMAPPACAR